MPILLFDAVLLVVMEEGKKIRVGAPKIGFWEDFNLI